MKTGEIGVILYDMNRNLFSTMICAAFLAAAVSGCGKSHPAPPSERNGLILRFFNSMQAGDAAAGIGEHDAFGLGEVVRRVGLETFLRVVEVGGQRRAG